MLNLYVCSSYNEKLPFHVIEDAEEEFNKIILDVSEDEKRLVKEIEQGELISCCTFIDRFGCKLHTDKLSTGSKTALAILHCEDCVSLRSCGNNARDAIIKYCKHGNAVMCWNDVTICDYGFDDEIDVSINGAHFTSIRELNDVLQQSF